MGKSRRLSRGWSEADVQFDENDDEAERDAARRAREEEAERAKSPAKQAARAASSSTVESWDKIADVYADCIKMCNDNKVNEKNSWSLKLIDHMDDVLKRAPEGAAQGETEDGVTNFQVASCTLDAGVKIYAYRVDSVYSSAFKVLGGLNRSGTAADGAEADDDAEGAGTDAQDGDAPPPTSRKPKRSAAARSAANTLASAASLDAKQGPAPALLDPLFRKVSGRFDAGGARGLLLANLSAGGEYSLALTGGRVAGEDGAAAVTSAPPGPLALDGVARFVPDSRALRLLSVGSAFANFWAAKSAEAGLGEGKEAAEAARAAAAAAEADAISDSRAAASSSVAPAELPWLAATSAAGLDAASACGDDGIGGADEGSAPFGDDDDDEAEGAYAAREAMLDSLGAVGDDDDDGVAVDVDMLTAAAAAASAPSPRAASASAEGAGAESGAGAGLHLEEAPELQYGLRARLGRDGAWAGPAHWKFKPTSSAEPDAAAGGARAAGGGRRARRALVIDVGAADHAANAAAIRARPSRGTSQLTAAALAKQAAEVCTLPRDHRIEQSALISLFGRPHVRATRLRALAPGAKAQHGLAGAESGGARELEAEGESGWAGPGFDNADDDDGADDGFGAPMDADAEDGMGGGGGGGGLALLDAPKAVQQIEVNYAKVAKKVNIRALKESLWGALDPAPPKDGVAAKSPAAAPVAFSSAMSTLAQSAPADSLKDVSVAYCFICLLHLANEKGLAIESQDDLADLSVRHPVRA